MKYIPRLAGIFVITFGLIMSTSLASAKLTEAVTMVESRIADRFPHAVNSGESEPMPDLALPGARVQRALLDDMVAIEASVPGIHVAFYFRDLSSGVSAGYRENEGFYPASLLKVPAAMALYKDAEHDPQILDKKLLYDAPFAQSVQHFPPPTQIRLGKTYATAALVERALRYSDNEAFQLMFSSISDTSLEHVTQALGLSDTSQEISPATYARLLEVLYEGTYLTRSSSDRLLALLSETTFDHGLRAGVPNDVRVAHKFGEHRLGSEQQLHDCGIVYLPEHPYAICVMTRGQSPDTLASVIARISQATYQEVTATR